MRQVPDNITAQVAAGSIVRTTAELLGDIVHMSHCGPASVYEDSAREAIVEIRQKLDLIEAGLGFVSKSAAA